MQSDKAYLSEQYRHISEKMFEHKFLKALAKEAIQSAETEDGAKLDLGELVRLEIDLKEVEPVVQVEGRAGTFYKFRVTYEVLAEFEKDVEAKEVPDLEVACRALRLNTEGHLLAISDRI